MAVADAVLQRDAPLPARSGANDAQGTATARSQGSQWLQASNGLFSVCPTSKARRPEQSTKKSPSTCSP